MIMNNWQYPKHFTYPQDVRVWFNDHIPTWERCLSSLFNKPNICLEIGAFHGASTVYIKERLCSSDGSHLYVMDINASSYLIDNIKPYKDITFLQGESRDSFKKLEHNGQTKEFLDFVYVDGSHMSMHVLEDAVNAFYHLKDGGIMIFDDYLGGLEQAIHMQVKTGVDAFAHAHRKHLVRLFSNYQMGLIKKTNFNEGELKENYYAV